MSRDGSDELLAATLRGRLTALEDALEARSSARPDAIARVLGERARELARPLVPERTGAAEDVLVFRLGANEYALEARAVVEVTRVQRISALPGAPPQFVGVTNLRGLLLPLVDLSALLGTPSSGGGVRRLAVVVGAAEAEFGVLVDSVEDVRSLPLSELGNPTGAGEAPLPKTRGITRRGLVVLDATALLTDSLLIIEEASRAAPASGDDSGEGRAR